MRYAVLADIHANLEALEAVLGFVEGKAEAIVCLGDLVGYQANPVECVRLVRERGIPCVAGNHDRVAAGVARPDYFSAVATHAVRWTARQLGKEDRKYLAELPMVRRIEEDVLLVHGALHPCPNADYRIRSSTDADKSFEVMGREFPGVRVCFFGHTHRVVGYEWIGGVSLEITGGRIELDPKTRYMINPGSVGQSRDDDPRAALAIFDSGTRIVSFHRVEYDRGTAWRKTQDAGLLETRSRLRRCLAWIVRGRRR